MTNELATVATPSGVGFISYCCGYGQYRGFCGIISAIPACLLVAILLKGLCRKPARLPHPGLVWWAERLALSAFAFGCLLFLLDVVHTGVEMGIPARVDAGFILYSLWGAVVIVVPFAAVGFVGIVIAMILKLASK